jgi:hypothetical protein
MKDMLERKFKDRVVEYEIKIDKIAVKVRELEKQERQAANTEERLRIAGEKQVLRKKIRELRRVVFDLEENMEDDIDDKITLAQQASEGEVKQERLFEIRFTITT